MSHAIPLPSAVDKSSDSEKVKPRFRGVSHFIAFFFAIAGCIWLVRDAAPGTATVVAGIYGVTLMLLFGISGLYHRRMWGPRGRALMRRLDHVGIFVFIAGSYTPLCALGLPPEDAKTLLTIAWVMAALGTVHALFFVHAFRSFNALLFVLMGCAMLPYATRMAAGVGDTSILLVLVGGAIFIAGAVVYARRWPNPAPATFGYHEVFHLMVIAAVGLHYAAIHRLVSAV